MTAIITVDNVVVSEHDGLARFYFRLSEPSSSVVSVNYSTQAGSAGTSAVLLTTKVGASANARAGNTTGCNPSSHTPARMTANRRKSLAMLSPSKGVHATYRASALRKRRAY